MNEETNSINQCVNIINQNHATSEKLLQEISIYKAFRPEANYIFELDRMSLFSISALDLLFYLKEIGSNNLSFILMLCV